MSEKKKRPDIPDSADDDDALDIFADDIDSKELEKPTVTPEKNAEQTNSNGN